MLRAVQRSHPAVVLVPHAEVFELAVNAAACRDQLEGVSPIHANEVDRAVDAEGGQVPDRRFQKLHELEVRHFAGGHLKLSMLDCAQTADMTVDSDVLWRSGQPPLRFLRFELTITRFCS